MLNASRDEGNGEWVCPCLVSRRSVGASQLPSRVLSEPQPKKESKFAAFCTRKTAFGE